MAAYYNEFEPYAAEWLRNLIKQGLIPDGEVDTRSIVDVRPDDLRGFTQCHFFAGLGGWSYAARLAGWPDDRPLWTGSCPCQPFSVAGKGKGQSDARHLWPEWFRLIRECRPSIVFGEQVAAAIGKDWLDGVFADLEGEDYACGAVVLPACAVDAPHRRDRLWFVADPDSERVHARQRDGAAARYWHPADATGTSDCASLVAHPDQPVTSEGRQQRSGQLGGAGGNPQSGDVEHPESVGRGEGRPEHEIRSGRSTASSASLSSSDVGHAIGAGLEGQPRHGHDGREPGRLDAVEAGSASETGGRSDVADACATGRDRRSQRDIDQNEPGQPAPRGNYIDGCSLADGGSGGPWSGASWLIGADGKARRIPQSGVRGVADGLPAGLVRSGAAIHAQEIQLLASGVPARVGKLRALGNAIVPQVAAEVLKVMMGSKP